MTTKNETLKKNPFPFWEKKKGKSLKNFILIDVTEEQSIQ